MTAALSDEEIEERFYMEGSRQVVAMLGQFIYRSIPVSVNFNNGMDTMLTTLLEARPQGLVFDLGGDPNTNKRLLRSPSCTFVSAINGIRVQFSTQNVRQIWWADADAFEVDLPQRVLRLQRREAYRMAMPRIKTVSVRLKYRAHEVGQEEDSPIHDLGVTGMGLSFSKPPHLETGLEIDCIDFKLPEFSEIVCPGVVRHVTQLPEGLSKHSYRVGIAFKDLPRRLEMAIQRYIIVLEHSRLKAKVDVV